MVVFRPAKSDADVVTEDLEIPVVKDVEVTEPAESKIHDRGAKKAPEQNSVHFVNIVFERLNYFAVKLY